MYKAWSCAVCLQGAGRHRAAGWEYHSSAPDLPRPAKVQRRPHSLALLKIACHLQEGTAHLEAVYLPTLLASIKPSCGIFWTSGDKLLHSNMWWLDVAAERQVLVDVIKPAKEHGCSSLATVGQRQVGLG